MEEPSASVEARLARVEAALARLQSAVLGPETGTTLALPLRLLNPDGVPVIELSADSDGGYIHIKDLRGNLRVTMGCQASGGWLDIHHAATGSLAVTLTAHEDGGAIELTENRACYAVRGEQYWPITDEAPPERP